MRNFQIFLALAGTAIAMPAIASDAARDVNYDCALYNECGTVGQEDAGDVRGGFTMRRPNETTAVRQAEEVRGGFTMKRQPVVIPAQAAETATRARIAPRRTQVAVATTAPTPGNMQERASIRAAQQITFVSGSAVLQPGAKRVVSNLAAAMLRADKINERFRIEGHTDAVGARESNMDLSARRAQAVAAELTALGVSAKRLDVVGYGFDQPLAGLSKFAAENRRVVAKVIN